MNNIYKRNVLLLKQFIEIPLTPLIQYSIKSIHKNIYLLHKVINIRCQQ